MYKSFLKRVIDFTAALVGLIVLSLLIIIAIIALFIANKLLSDAERLTKAGAFVRKTSLDEIPQLINVLKGDMSLVFKTKKLASSLA